MKEAGARQRLPLFAFRGDPERGADLERLFLPAGADHLRQFEDTAARADRVRRRIHHRLGGAVHRADTGGAADYTLLYIVLSKQFISGITQGAVK
ncbi:hypothetical protein [Mesorhizobium sp. WSM3859]|uniref:hypothetical protein n=1 Tax=Mesorhizobium sp. WSM3859 TaxID=2029402 RepID=UPI001FE094AE|nr:hypothetical protein [Mesorhizobium sp. WSM3859]